MFDIFKIIFKLIEIEDPVSIKNGTVNSLVFTKIIGIVWVSSVFTLSTIC